MTELVSGGLLRETQSSFGQRRSKFVKCVAGHNPVSETLCARSDPEFAHLMRIFDATIGEAGARPFFRCPQVKAKAAAPCHDDGSDNDRHGGLLPTDPRSTPGLFDFWWDWSQDDLPQTLGTGGSRRC
jgi:hypothetical protein